MCNPIFRKVELEPFAPGRPRDDISPFTSRKRSNNVTEEGEISENSEMSKERGSVKKGRGIMQEDNYWRLQQGEYCF